MKVLSERNQVRVVADQWKKQYSRECNEEYKEKQQQGIYNPFTGETYPIGEKKKIYEKLCALDKETATAEDVAKIIGNDSWVKPWECGECGKASWQVAEVGEDANYESYTAYVCLDCLKKAVDLLQQEGK